VPEWGIFWLAPFVAWLGAVLGTRAMLVGGISDKPDEVRKAHDLVVPTAGGIGMALGTGVAVLLVLAFPNSELDYRNGSAGHNAALVVLLSAFGASLGLADDIWKLASRLKFVLLAAASLTFAAFGAHANALPITNTIALSLGPIGAIIGTALWIFTVANTVNFTDGANGLSMGSTAIGLATLGLLCLIHGEPVIALLALCIAGSLAGSLVLNFPKGRLFAGDAGALFAGLAVGGVGAVAASIDVAPWAIALCFLPQLADVLLTLAWRLSKRRNLLASHRDHMFQIGLRAGVSHGRIAALYWVLTAHCCVCAVAGALLGPLAALVALAVNAAVGVMLFSKVRNFAAAHGHDGE
jgi:UDP-GlcNAc:undecaprenyl-phosphate GlcNAc-1-phosphate transferase